MSPCMHHNYAHYFYTVWVGCHVAVFVHFLLAYTRFPLTRFKPQFKPRFYKCFCPQKAAFVMQMVAEGFTFRLQSVRFLRGLRQIFAVSCSSVCRGPWLEPSGVGTNFKVGAPVRSKSWGTDPAQSAGKKLFGRAPPLFGTKSTISRFGERFRDGQYSLVGFLFAVLLLTVPPVPSHL